MKYVAIIETENELSGDTIEDLKNTAFIGSEQNPYCFEMTSIKPTPEKAKYDSLMIGIKNMEIPKSCAECSFVVDDMCGGATCILLCDEWKDNENHRAENCPLTEIITCGEDIMSDLPTADVIEREKIDKAIEEIQQAICSYGFCFVSRGMNLALDILKKNIGENK